jgi:translation initiation factor 2B subunit (eIF-2B alpha/beta/delta family)|tara:strand:+ start:111 stop:479 length:369 start_codon:yes stop_codon:yes gene_type:complete
MEIAIHDKILDDLQNELENKKNMLKNKYENLNTVKESNEFLSDVLEDYDKYYKFILEQKQQQEVTMKNIIYHIDKIIKEENLSNESLLEAKKEQNTILNEIDKVKNEIDEIILISNNKLNEK